MSEQNKEDGIMNMLYFSSDGLAFFDRQAAQKHADTLSNTIVCGKTKDEVRREIDAVSNETWQHDMQELMDELSDED